MPAILGGWMLNRNDSQGIRNFKSQEDSFRTTTSTPRVKYPSNKILISFFGGTRKNIRWTGGAAGDQANTDSCINFVSERSNFVDTWGGGKNMAQFCGRLFYGCPPKSLRSSNSTNLQAAIIINFFFWLTGFSLSESAFYLTLTFIDYTDYLHGLFPNIQMFLNVMQALPDAFSLSIFPPYAVVLWDDLIFKLLFCSDLTSMRHWNASRINWPWM